MVVVNVGLLGMVFIDGECGGGCEKGNGVGIFDDMGKCEGLLLDLGCVG